MTQSPVFQILVRERSRFFAKLFKLVSRNGKGNWKSRMCHSWKGEEGGGWKEEALGEEEKEEEEKRGWEQRRVKLASLWTVKEHSLPCSPLSLTPLSQSAGAKNWYLDRVRWYLSGNNINIACNERTKKENTKNSPFLHYPTLALHLSQLIWRVPCAVKEC